MPLTVRSLPPRSFNVGIFCAVLGGFGLGALLCGHWGRGSQSHPGPAPPSAPLLSEAGEDAMSGCH